MKCVIHVSSSACVLTVTTGVGGPGGRRDREEQEEDGHKTGSQEDLLRGVSGGGAGITGSQVWSDSRAVWGELERQLSETRDRPAHCGARGGGPGLCPTFWVSTIYETLVCRHRKCTSKYYSPHVG